MKDTRFSKILAEGAKTPKSSDSGRSTPSTPTQTSTQDRDGSRPHPPSTSLYEDTLSRRTKSPWRTVALIVVGLLIGAGLLAFFLGGSSDSKPLITLPQEMDAAGTGPPPSIESKEERSDAAPSVAEESEKPEPAAAPSPKPTTPAAPAPERSTPHATDLRASASSHSEEQPPPAKPLPEPPPESPPRAAGAVAPAQPSPVVEQPKAPIDPKPSKEDRAPVESTASPAENTSSTPTDSSEAVQPTPVRGAAEYERLLDRSEVAARLAGGGFSTIQFVGWRIVQQNTRETWIDLIGRWTSSGDEVHFIWSVGRDSGEVRALSEAARNLEHSASSSGS